MSKHIVLKKNPKIEFQFHDDGFHLFDGQTAQNTGFYNYSELQGVELNKAWFPRVSQWLRVITWVLNGVPYFPDAESCKKANVKLLFSKTKFGIWLTDASMADQAKRIKALLDQKTQQQA